MKIVNLLPKSRQEEIYYENILRGIFKVFWISIFSFMVVFLAQLGAKYYIQNRTKNIQGDIITLQKQISKQDNDKLKAQIGDINNTIDDYDTLAATNPKWSKVIKAFLPLPPPGVSITTFSANTSLLTASIRGHSPTREAVIALYNNIAQDGKNFYNINYPLENVVKSTNVDFHFEFSIRPELIK